MTEKQCTFWSAISPGSMQNCCIDVLFQVVSLYTMCGSLLLEKLKLPTVHLGSVYVFVLYGMRKIGLFLGLDSCR